VVTIAVYRRFHHRQKVVVGQIKSYTCNLNCGDHFDARDAKGTWVGYENDISNYPVYAIEALIEAAGYQADKSGRWVQKKELKTKR